MRKALIGLAALVSACASDYRMEPILWEVPYTLETMQKGDSVIELEKFNTRNGEIWRYSINDRTYAYLIEGKRPTALIRENEKDTLFKAYGPGELNVPQWVKREMLTGTEWEI
jgi:hypothetical protein